MNEIIVNYIQKEILGDHSEIKINADDDLLSDGLIDSMGIMKLIAFLEREFDLKVPPQDMTIEHFMTVEAIENYLKQRKTK